MLTMMLPLARHLEAAAGTDDQRRLALLDDGRAVEGLAGGERVAVVDGGRVEVAELREVDGARALDRSGRRGAAAACPGSAAASTSMLAETRTLMISTCVVGGVRVKAAT